MSLEFSSLINLWYFIGFIGMMAATAFPVYRYWRDGEKLKFYISQVGITGIAMVAYLLMYLGVGIFSYNGAEVALTRYIDWLLTTPFMVATLAVLSKPGRSTVVKLVVLDLLVMSVGALGPFIDFPVYWAVFGFGSLAYAAMLYLILGPVSSGPGLRNEKVRIVFTKLRNLTVVLWTLYPVVVILGPQALNLLDQTSQALVISYLDLISKGVFVVIGCRGVQKIGDFSFRFES